MARLRRGRSAQYKFRFSDPISKIGAVPGFAMARRGDTMTTHRLTLREAWDDVGWFSATFSSIVGGPSLLALFQMVFVEYRFVDALQWIVDGYNDIVSVLAAYVEPLMTPVIAWLNEMFSWRLDLHAHWRPLFLLTMIWVTASTRMNWQPPVRIFDVVVGLPLLALASLIGAAAAGVIAVDARWLGQAVMAAAPVATVHAAMALIGAAGEVVESRRVSSRFGSSLAFAGVITALAFLVGAGMSFLPTLSAGGGIVALATLVMAVGALYLAAGLASGRVFGLRMGLTVLGGFFTAAMILAADVIIKALTA